MKIILPQNDVSNVDETDFEGSSVYNIIGMYYLSHKPPNNICVIYGEPYQKDNGKTLKGHKHDESCVLMPHKISMIPNEQRDVSLRWIDKEKRISVPEPKEKFWKNFLKCNTKRFIALPFGFNCKDYGHANYFIFDTEKKTLERFESFGKVTSKCLKDDIVNQKIVELFKENLKGTKYEDFTYIKPLEFLPEENVQTIQEEEDRWLERKKKNPVGFCSVWSLWYIDLRTSNPDIEPHALIRQAIEDIKKLEEKRKGSFTDFIRRYSLLFVNTLNEFEKRDGGMSILNDIFDGECVSCKPRKRSLDGKNRRSTNKRSTNKRSANKRSSRPTNPALYERAKKEIYSIYKKPSAFRSGALVKRYKQLGGKYAGAKKQSEGLSRWFREKWGDVGHKGYPVFRPSKRISKKTPLLASEIDSDNLKRQISLKQKIKGLKNLPKFLRKNKKSKRK